LAFDDSNSSTDDSAEENDAPNLSPEVSKLLLPSSLGVDYSNSANFDSLVKQEIHLRLGEANDALHELRINLGFKAFLYRTSVRNANSHKKKTRAFSSTAAAIALVKSQFHIYSGARKALVRLGASAEILSKYQKLSKDDLKVRTITHDPSIHGQRHSHLPWFWTMDVNSASNDSDWMGECE
jgi:hypothetical protein